MSSSGELPLLHGDLDLTIHEARGLPNMDVLSTVLRRLCFCPETTSAGRSKRSVSGDDDASVHNHNNHHHHHHRRRHHKPQPHGHHILPTSDPYAAVVVPGPPDVTLARTHVVRNSEAPVWSTRIVVPLAHFASRIFFQVKDADPFGSDLIGVAALTADQILGAADKPIVSLWLDLFRPDGHGTPKPDSAICVSATFIPADRTTCFWREGGGVPAYFPPRRGCEVKLYQDAHVAAGELEGVFAEPGRCWEDLCLAVLSAQHLVYVVGWSVHTEVRLLREAMSPEMKEKAEEVRTMGGVAVENMNLGQLLKYKSQEGVRICLLVWDDKTSHDSFFFRTGGVMQTHDEETKRFFKHSSVICVLSPRYPSSKLSMFKQKVVGTLYSHHQKCVLVDTPASEATRRITAFLGGLDLCPGRYDTPSHRLFRDLGTVFRGDVYNQTFNDAGTRTAGPRQPWHDLHCRLDGPAAYDVLRNFEQRWRKATKLRAMFGKASTHWKDDALLKLERIPWIVSPYKLRSTGAGDDGHGLHVLPEDDPECWHAQVFRSVDSGSVKGFPRPWETEEMEQYHLLGDRNVAVEQSIHTAYVAAIRSAERFVYIENQYFIGSSYAWPSYRHPGAGNLVPMEIALKVAGKIKARERFAAYVVIPMWPEGNPSSGPAQEILFWQRQTMEMMYGVIAREIASVGLEDAHPSDYLNFYCLGNREEETVRGGGDWRGEPPPGQPDSTSPAAKARRHRRFMVYVHSKGMIVDDEYVILGSANINQRSLSGSRDTELAVGAYQPHRAASGKVCGYRMSLWEEHLGRDAVRRPEVDWPESRECVRMVNRIARDNWDKYTADALPAPLLQGHLMKYPLHVSADGKVGPLPGQETFPDVGGRIVGSNNNLPDYLTM